MEIKLPKALLSLSFISLFCLTSFGVLDISKALPHPGIAAMGGAGLADYRNFAGIINNPSILGSINTWGGNIYSSTFEETIKNLSSSIFFNIYDLTFNLSYFSQAADNIPITDYINERIRANGSFSAGISQYLLGVGKQFNEVLWFKDLNVGYSAGMQSYTFSAEQNLFHRAGLVFSTIYNNNLYFSSVVSAGDNNNVGYGVSYIEPAYKLNLDYTDSQIKTGVEYLVNNFFQLRTGIEPRYYSLGIGINYDKLYGPLNINLALNLDFCYQIALQDYYSPYSYIAMTLYELEKVPAPLIYKYPALTNTDNITVSGWADKNSRILLYVNNALLGKTSANDSGQWEARVFLDKTINTVKAQVAGLSASKMSNFSKEVTVIKDLQPPNLSIEALVMADEVELSIKSSETLFSDVDIINKQKQNFKISKIEGLYKNSINKNELAKGFTVNAKDQAGNIGSTSVENPFIKFFSPEQRLIITYHDRLSFNGIADRFSEILVRNKLNGFSSALKLQKIGQFEQNVPLDYGKNILEVEEQKDNYRANYPFKVIRLFQYKDTANENFYKLATIGVLNKELYFMGNKNVSQREAVVWLNRFKELSYPNNYEEQAYRYAIANKWIENKDDSLLLTRRIAIDMIARSLALNIHNTQKEFSYFPNISLADPYLKAINYMVEHGFINSKDNEYDINKFVSKEEFILWLTRTEQLEVLYSHYFKDDF